MLHALFQPAEICDDVMNLSLFWWCMNSSAVRGNDEPESSSSFISHERTHHHSAPAWCRQPVVTCGCIKEKDSPWWESWAAWSGSAWYPDAWVIKRDIRYSVRTDSTNISDLISRTGSSACRTAAGHLCIAIIVYSLHMKFLPCWTEQTRLQGENRLPDGGWTDRHTVKCSVIWSFFRVTDIKAQSVLHGLYSIFSSSSSDHKWKNVRLSLQTILLF